MDEERTLTDDQIETTLGQDDAFATADVDADDLDTGTDEEDADTDDADV
jgi:hypothetical protein